jgi:hypothetical protein
LLSSLLDGGEWTASPTAALPPGKEPPVSIGYEAGWVSEPVLTLLSRDNSLALVGNRTPAAQPVAIPTELSRPILQQSVAFVVTDVRYNRVKVYSRKYTIGHITNTRNKHRKHNVMT